MGTSFTGNLIGTSFTARLMVPAAMIIQYVPV